MTNKLQESWGQDFPYLPLRISLPAGAARARISIPTPYAPGQGWKALHLKVSRIPVLRSFSARASPPPPPPRKSASETGSPGSGVSRGIGWPPCAPKFGDIFSHFCFLLPRGSDFAFWAQNLDLVTGNMNGFQGFSENLQNGGVRTKSKSAFFPKEFLT